MSTPGEERDPTVEATWRTLWRPPHAALGTLGCAVAEHWRKARDQTLQLFTPTGGSWLRAAGARAAHHLTRGGKLIR
jgi:hypothetical protein